MADEYCYRYPRAAVQADAVLLSVVAGRLSTLLIRRSQEPGRGQWSFPGGHMEMDETAGQTAARELEEETGVSGVTLQQVGAFSKLDRDPRGRAVSVAFYAVVDASSVEFTTSDEASEVKWFAIGSLPELAFDHSEILAAALRRARLDLNDPELSGIALPDVLRSDVLKALIDELI